VVPIINQIKTELNEGSSEIIQSSKDKQLIVFHDDRSSNPTHSLLSKDHFSNVSNLKPLLSTSTNGIGFERSSRTNSLPSPQMGSPSTNSMLGR
jgi:glycerophosphoryl diester phosphodiesterase